MEFFAIVKRLVDHCNKILFPYSFWCVTFTNICQMSYHGFDIVSIVFIVLALISIFICLFVFIGLNRSWFMILCSTNKKHFDPIEMINHNGRNDIEMMPVHEEHRSDILKMHAVSILAKNKLKLRPEIDEDLYGISRQEVELILPEILSRAEYRNYVVIDIGSNYRGTDKEKHLTDFVLSWLHNNGYKFTQLRKRIYKIHLTQRL